MQNELYIDILEITYHTKFQAKVKSISFSHYH